MHHPHPAPRTAPIATSLASLLALAATLTAQVPENSIVVSRFQGGGATAALGGLSLIDLANPGTVTSITGLSTELTGSTSGTGNAEGAASVLVDRRTGNLIVGEHALPGDETDIHVLYMVGTGVVLDERHTVGIAPGGGGWVDQMAWLNDDVVFTVRGGAMTSGPMQGHLLGVLRPQLGPPGTPGTITPVPMSPVPAGYVNALAVDERTSTAYFGLFLNGTSSEIWSVPVPGDGVTPATPVLVTALAAGILNMTVDGDGTLLVGTVNGLGNLVRVDPAQTPATITPLPFGINDVNGISMENANGNMLIAESYSGTIFRWRPGQLFTNLGTVSGGASGIAMRETMAPYGVATPGQNSYHWRLRANPGGTPSIGNAGFSMTVESSPGTALGIAGLSLGEASLATLGVNLLLDPASLVLPTTLLPAAQSTVPLPIPANATLAGMQIFAQAFFFEGAGWAASRGLCVTLIP